MPNHYCIERLFLLIFLAFLSILPTQASTRAVPKPSSTRWFPPFQRLSTEQQRRPNLKRHKQSHCTIVRRLASSFENVFQGSCYTEPMIRACKDFVVAMRETGQHSVARDLEQNIAKVERLYHSCKNPHQRKSISGLLEFERQQGIHGPGGILKDPSGAMGLLWIRRSLALQHSLYTRVIQNQHPMEAALSAYRSTVQPYHGWALQKVYVIGVQRTGLTRQEMLRTIGGYAPEQFGPQQEKTTVEDLKRLLSAWEPIIEHCQQTHEKLDLEDKRRV